VEYGRRCPYLIQGVQTVKHRIHHVRSLLIALTALALSAGLALGATPTASSTGLAVAAVHAGKSVPVVNGGQDVAGDGDETSGEDEDVEETEDVEGDGDETAGEEVDAGETEDVEGSEESEEAGDNCTTDPTLLGEEELAELNHGSIVCWAAHQTVWAEWFSNHGAFVSCWAHHGKADAASCTEDPTLEEPTLDEPTVEEPADAERTDKASKGHANGKAHATSKAHAKGHGKVKSGR
jgi:hypothetical protein